jgi:hypothetical protein
VYEPKERIIDAPQFRDKVVQLAVNNILKQVYQPCFIFDSYGSIDNKGTHKCSNRIQHFLRKSKWLYGEGAYIIKLDVEKFFYNINRTILKNSLTNKIKCQETLRLLFIIINSADKISDLGLPLGNTLSQIGANIYLNRIDHYCKRKLGLKFYVRYMDDIIIVVENRELANIIKSKVNEYLKNELNLNINNKKTKIFPLNQGINSIGYKIYTTHKLLRNNSKKKIKQKTKKFKILLKENNIDVEKVEQILNSWLGHATNSDSHNFINKLVTKNDYIFINGNYSLKIKGL